jgi:hypothetical protein
MACLLLLQEARVGQEDLEQVARAAGAPHPTLEAGFHELWQVSRMVDVRVREHDGVDGIGLKR